MNKAHKLILLLRAIPKSIYFNFKYFDFKDAIKFPVLISHRVMLKKTKGEVIIEAPLNFGMIRIGFGEHLFFSDPKLRSTWDVDGIVKFKGSARIGNGTKLCVKGKLTLGNNFMISANSQIRCVQNITFGDDVLMGWDCLFLDTDGHKILNNEGIKVNSNKDITVGNKVWFGARSTVLKGSEIASDVVVAAGSFVLGKHDTSHCIIGGHPAGVIKENISWQG